MDVVKQKNQTSKNAKRIRIAAVAVTTGLLISWISWSSNQVSVSRNEILVERVKQGDLEVTVNGYGTLRSDKEQLITAISRATVKEIVLKPGATVTADSIIVRMENPDLTQLVQSARLELEQLKANLRQLKLNQTRETLDETFQLASLSSNLEKAKLMRSSKEKLFVKGIVSELDYRAAELEEKQWQRQLQLSEEAMAKLELVHKESVLIQEDKIRQQQGVLNNAQNRLDELDVKAGIDGVLQSLSVDLGQSIEPGHEIARIGSLTDLIALIKVPQNQAQIVRVGQQVVVNTRRDEITGTVARIDPIVENNTVNVEVNLPEALPGSAKPQLNVDVIIIADTLKNVTYIKRPPSVAENSSDSLFLLDEAQEQGIARHIQFGRRAGESIEIVSGASLGEHYIVSDLEDLRGESSQLQITN